MVAVSGRPLVQRTVELDTAQGHVGILVVSLHALQAHRIDDLGQFEATVHDPGGIRTDDPVGNTPL